VAETNGELKMEGRNERALAVYSRVQKKLTGEHVSQRVMNIE
jgi:hypothetical protein